MKLFNKNSDKPKNSIAASFKTRSFRAGGYSAVATAIVIAIAVLVNVIVGALPVKYTQLDITPDGLYSISEQTETMVKELQDEITIYWIVQSGQEDVTLENMLNQYKSLSSKIN